MNCDDFKFEYTVAPDELSAQATKHASTCQECQGFIAEQDSFTLAIKQVVKVDVPEDFRHTLREKVSLKTAPSISNVIALKAWRLPQVSIALAASVLLSVILVNQFSSQSHLTIPIEQLVLEHLEHDSASALKASHTFSANELDVMEDEFGLEIIEPAVLQFAQRCPMGDTYGLHMVYRNDKGQPFTVLYMPEVALDHVQEFTFSGLKGWVKPVKKGSLAIVGGSTLELPEADSVVKNSLRWL